MPQARPDSDVVNNSDSKEPRSICFRFDVDTPKCLREGMPNLLSLAREMDVPFTFFVNPGRAIARRDLFARKKKSTSRENITKLSVRDKQSIFNVLELLVRNPEIVAIDKQKIIAQAIAQGHEIGLHGGHNHALWQHGAHTWGYEKIMEEIEFGMSALHKAGAKNITSFASPGWNSPASLVDIIPNKGIKLLADTHGATCDLLSRHLPSNLHSVNTNILGEPGGVGYIEHMAAMGRSNPEILEDFESRLNHPGPTNVVYDHPGYSGTQKLSLLKEMIRIAKKNNLIHRKMRDLLN